MKVMITTTRYVVLDTLFKAGGWMDAAALTLACGMEDTNSAYSIAKGLADIGLVETMKRRVDNHRTRVKLLIHWRISEAGVRLLDEYNKGRKKGRVDAHTGVQAYTGSPPEPELPSTPVSATPALTTPDWLMAATPVQPAQPAAPLETIMAMEAEIKRLRAQLTKYADIVVDVPNVGEVLMTKDEVHTLLQQLLELARGEG